MKPCLLRALRQRLHSGRTFGDAIELNLEASIDADGL
jgi:hypothetical protein